MICGIFEKNAVEEPGYLAVIAGARESLQIDRAFRLAMEAIEREVTCREIQGSHLEGSLTSARNLKIDNPPWGFLIRFEPSFF
jgi:hypothetical protein